MDKPPYSELPGPMDDSQVPNQPRIDRSREVIIIGGGLAGLSAAIYLGRALRDVLVIDAEESLAIWEPEVQNYLGFPESISGYQLLRRGREQARNYGAELIREEVDHISVENNLFHVVGRKADFTCRKLLLATGVYHLPPRIPAVDECVGKSVFFCKDCDGYRVQKRRVVIAGCNNEAVEYALGILIFTECVMLLTNGEPPGWDHEHQKWLRDYKVPVYGEKIVRVKHQEGYIKSIRLADDSELLVDCLFTTRGDVFHNKLARQLGAKVDQQGQVIVDHCQRTSVPGLYAAGCVTPANCQMIIAAGDGATAAQAINRELFEEHLQTGELLMHRHKQLRGGEAEPVMVSSH